MVGAAVPVLAAAAGGGHPLLDAISVLLVISGLMFFFGASVGIVRFPDFYTRMHAAGKGDTLSTVLITAGMAVHVMGEFDLAHWTVILVAIKILSIGVFIMLTSPTSTHALMKAGFDDGLEPDLADGKELVQNLGGPFLKGVEPAAPAVAEAPEPKRKASRKKSTKKAAKRATKKSAKKAATKKGAKKVPAKKAAKKAAAKRAAAKRAPAKKKAASKKAANKAVVKKKAGGRRKD